MTRSDGARFIRLAATVRQERDAVASVVAEGIAARLVAADPTPQTLLVRGMGAILHDFYTGNEHIFERIAVELDGGAPAGLGWHRDLLRAMTLDLPGLRPPVIGHDAARGLEEYLRFRHVFRNTYGYELEWVRVSTLLDRLPPTWLSVEADINQFLEFIDALGAT